MEHAYARSIPESPWRTAAIVAAAVAAVELLVLVLVGVVFGAKVVGDHAEKAVLAPVKAAASNSSTKPASTAEGAKATKSDAVPRLARNETSIIVLNGNGVSGAAAVVADRLRHFHYLVAATENAPRSDFGRSLVMYRPGFDGEAIRLGHDLHVRRVVPLDGMTRRDLQGAHLAIIIGG